MEIWDGYYEDGTLAGIDLVRGEEIPQGVYHLVTQVLVRHEDGDYLLMRRDPAKPNFGGWWEATAGGAALKGEGSEACARRELREETGIETVAFILTHRVVEKGRIYDCYLCVTGWEKSAVVMQQGETVDFRWVGPEEFAAFLDSEEMIPAQRRRCREEFKKRMERGE